MDKMIIINIACAMSDVTRKLNSIHQEVASFVSQVFSNQEPQEAQLEEDGPCHCCIQFEKRLVELFDNCEISWLRNSVRSTINELHKKCWEPMPGRASSPPPEAFPGPSWRHNDTPRRLRFKSRNRSFRNVLY